MARRKTSDKKVADKSNRTASVKADSYSIAFDQLHIDGDVSGDIRIGHNIGYTVEQVSVLLKQITTTFRPKPFDGRCPYKGLEVFEEEDAELFFGRERLVNELVGRVKESRTVFITGPSGSGKSSLVRAGLIHALKQGAIKGSDRWLYETMKPGREHLKDLALAFSRLKSPELQDYFLAHISETDILNKCTESVLSSGKDQRFVLFVDQFEEVFTQINSEEERTAFINMLAHAGTVENGRVIVLFAMRSDFVSNCATYLELNELLSHEFRQIGAMQPEELVSAIALPARHVGLTIEDELIARIISDMRGEPDALPLMQFALKDLFDAKQSEGGVIALTLKDYLQHGGIHKSLERHADATFAKFSASEQELARSIFSGLIEIGRGTQDTKRTTLFNELIPANTKPEEVQTIVQKLADARLIITDEKAGRDTVTISHEKLIEAWPWLKKLVNENRNVIALQNEIASDAKEWDEHKRDTSYLYTGARLANAREQLEARKLVLSGNAHKFVQASYARARRNLTTQVLNISVIVGLIISVAMLISPAARDAIAKAQAQKLSEITIVPAGSINFNLLGNNELIELPEFGIEVHPVTNRGYSLCVRVDKCTPPLLTADFNSVEKQDDPVAWVTILQAATYCEWVGRRMPSAPEWEQAVGYFTEPSTKKDRFSLTTHYEWTSSYMVENSQGSIGAWDGKIDNLNIVDWIFLQEFGSESSSGDLEIYTNVSGAFGVNAELSFRCAN